MKLKISNFQFKIRHKTGNIFLDLKHPVVLLTLICVAPVVLL
jgi:hypothetical protein